MCKCFRSIIDYPLRDDYRAFTCRICHERDRDLYCERKGEPILKEARVWRFTRAQRIVEKALQVWLREEKRKERWLDMWKRWEQGEFTEGWGITRAQIKGFQKGEEYCEGPYRQWVGYTDPREGSTGNSEAWNGPQGGVEGSTDESEGWDGPKRGSRELYGYTRGLYGSAKREYMGGELRRLTGWGRELYGPARLLGGFYG
jgi:hypothetical protein